MESDALLEVVSPFNAFTRFVFSPDAALSRHLRHSNEAFASGYGKLALPWCLLLCPIFFDLFSPGLFFGDLIKRVLSFFLTSFTPVRPAKSAWIPCCFQRVWLHFIHYSLLGLRV